MATELRIFALLIITFLLSAITEAQPFIRIFEGMPVTINSVPISQPFVGGIDAPQHQFVDIDGDGDFDLLIYDTDAHPDLYLNNGTQQIPNYKFCRNCFQFPSFQFWFLFADLNGDGLVDFCTDDSSSGVTWYKNTGTAQSPDFVLETKHMPDTSGHALFAGLSSIPAFVDIDGDSLIDFLSSNSLDGSINFYKNVGTRSSPRYALISTSYQNITVIGDTCFTSLLAPQMNDHGAGNLRFIDIDGNSTQDLFYGDIFSHGVFLMTNTGTPTQPHLQCTTNRYPPDGSLVTAGYNQPTFVDITGDGLPDMIVGVLNSMPQHNFWYYKNIGSVGSPDFQLMTKDFISTIDVGGNAHPAFADIDGNGTQDLFIGSLQGAIWHFNNTGTPAVPSFTLADTMFAGIMGNYIYAPVFVDIDGDSDKDLFIGRFDGHLKFYRNDGTAHSPNFVAEPSPVDTMNVIQNAAPAFIDIDGDGDLDLFIGRSNGKINFYRNDGDKTNFVPVLVTTTFENISVGGDAAPVFVDIDHDGDFDLFIGNANGDLWFYENTGSVFLPQFVLRTKHYGTIDQMLASAPAFTDIDGDGDMDLFVGTSKGGLHYYRNDLVTDIRVTAERPRSFQLDQNYPNPFNPKTDFRFRISNVEFITLQVIDIFGRVLSTLVSEYKSPGEYSVTWDATNTSSGVYYYRMITHEGSIVRKMVLIK